MKKGEKVILIGMAVLIGILMIRNMTAKTTEQDRELPFYSTLPEADGKKALELIRVNHCKDCHSLWGGAASFMESVPAPRLDGIGSLKEEKWLYDYLSSEDPQKIIPSRLKAEYRMPSFAALPESDRRTIAQYLYSLKVKDWYLNDAKKHEFEKLTGKEYKP